MVDPTTTNLSFSIPTRGSDAGTWDTPINGNFTELDSLMSAVTTKGLTSGSSTTLSTTECQAMVIKLTGAINAGLTLTFSVVKEYIVDNQCTGTAAITMQAPGGGNKVSTPPGSRKRIWSDGTNVAYSVEEDPGTLKFVYNSALPPWMSAFTLQPWFICDGSTFTAASYPALNAILGGNTLPDFRGRTPFALDGGTGRITNAISGIIGTTLGAAGGSQALHAHNHTGVTGTQSLGIAYDNNLNVSTGANPVQRLIPSGTGTTAVSPNPHSHTIATDGTGASQNMPPAVMAGVMLIKS